MTAMTSIRQLRGELPVQASDFEIGGEAAVLLLGYLAIVVALVVLVIRWRKRRGRTE